MSTSILEALVSPSPTFRCRNRRGFRIAGVAGTAWSALLSYRRIRRIEADLSALDERMLRDIGLTRTEIPYLAHNGRHSRLDLTGF